MKRTETRQVKVGNLEIGHNNHVIIQSMCNIETNFKPRKNGMRIDSCQLYGYGGCQSH